MSLPIDAIGGMWEEFTASMKGRHASEGHVGVKFSR